MRIERNPSFWREIASHEDVSHITCGEVVSFEEVALDNVMPYACECGGYIFIRLDPFGRIYDLHSLFTPVGWGVTAYNLGVEALNTLPDWQVITTYQTEHPQSRPPKSFGFQAAGDFSPTPYGLWKTWVLTRTSWESSPAFKREARKCQP